MSADRSSYHHGNARSALLAAAETLLEQNGAAGLSLREIASSAGLSRQAPYNHFADKKALLAELVRDGFDRLAANTRQMTMRSSEPQQQLAAAAEAYIGFGQTHPALFRLMFGKEFVDPASHPTAREAASAARAELSAIVGAMVSADQVQAVTLVAWSLVHGYTNLCVEAGLEGPDVRAERADLFALTVAAIARSGHR